MDIFQGRQLSHFASLLKGVYSKRKEFAPLGSKFFPFRVDPFSEGIWYADMQTESHKNCLLGNKWWKIQQAYSVPVTQQVIVITQNNENIVGSL